MIGNGMVRPSLESILILDYFIAVLFFRFFQKNFIQDTIIIDLIKNKQTHPGV